MILIFKISLSNPTNYLNFKIYDVKTWSKNSHIENALYAVKARLLAGLQCNFNNFP